MPEGIEVVVENGFATVRPFGGVNRGKVVGQLLKHTTPEFVDVDTSGRTKAYIVPESVARAAGFIDAPSEPETPKDPPKNPFKSEAPAEVIAETVEVPAEAPVEAAPVTEVQASPEVEPAPVAAPEPVAEAPEPVKAPAKKAPAKKAAPKKVVEAPAETSADGDWA